MHPRAKDILDGSLAGGAATLCLIESVTRAPGFSFQNLIEAGTFVAYVLSRFEAMKEKVRETSRFAHLVEVNPVISCKEAYIICHYTTGDAAGQNMVTFATAAICEMLLASSPVQPLAWFIEANMSGDKKPTQLSFQTTRGKKVIADVTIPRELVKQILHTEPEAIFKYWQLASSAACRADRSGWKDTTQTPLRRCSSPAARMQRAFRKHPSA